MMNSDATIKCTKDCDHHWTTDDAYHWYFQDCAGYGAGTQLEEYDFQTVEDWTEENDGIDPFEIPFVDPNQIELGFYDQVEVISTYSQLKVRCMIFSTIIMPPIRKKLY
jgi:hypothetical protein